MTDEQIVRYLDAATDRENVRWRAGVDATRLGYLLAHDSKAFRRWRRDGDAAEGRPHGLTGNALEQAIGHVAGVAGASVRRGTITLAEMARRRAEAAVPLVPHPVVMVR